MADASVFLATPEDTTHLAAHMATLLGMGDVVLLEGQIGAGKTHFARAVIQALLDVPEDVPSPTFTLVQTYQAKIEIWHADLYRLTDPSEIEELGLIDAFETSLCLVEWPDRLGDLAPRDAIRLTFAPEDQGRRLTIATTHPRHTTLVRALSAHA